MNVHDLVIPSWYLPMEFVFAGIPVGGYVAFFTAKNHQYIHPIAALLPYGIGPRHVRREYTTFNIQFERDVIGVQTFGRHSDQNPQGVGLYDCVHSLYIFDGEVVWDVHCLYEPLKNLMTEFSGESGLP
jgi:hypothetical protein